MTNISFSFQILNGNVECLDYFRNKLIPEKSRKIILNMTELIITHEFPFQLRSSQHTLIRTVVYFWSYLDEEDKCRVVRKYFPEFYQFLLNSPRTESLTSAIQWYEPSKCTSRENRCYLQNTAQKITSDLCEGQRYRSMFQSLYKIAKKSFSTIDVLNLLEVCSRSSIVAFYRIDDL